MEFWAEVTRLSDIYRFTNKEEDLINVMEYMERYIGVSAKMQSIEVNSISFVSRMKIL